MLKRKQFARGKVQLLCASVLAANFLIIWHNVTPFPDILDKNVVNEARRITSTMQAKQNEAIVIVLSSAANSERRKMIRDTWWNDLGSESGWDGVFLVGAAEDNSLLAMESQQYGDIWFGQEPDQYASPSIFRRLMAAFDTSREKNYKWVIKADDDTLVNLDFWKGWIARREP